MDIVPFPLIDTFGSAFERGIQYGRQAAQRIERTLAIYRPAFEKVGVSRKQARSRARTILERIGAYDREMVIELNGMAEGCGRPVEDLVAINARTELLYGEPQSAGEALPEDGCTSVAAMPVATRHGQVLHGQNWDWRDDCYEAVVVLRATMPDGMRILTMAEAGMLARCGLNSAGIALTGNFLKCELDTGQGGVPIPCVRRRVLLARHLRDGIAEILNAPRSFSNNMVVSHRDGEVIDLETTPGPVFWMHAERGVLVHANHFMTSGAAARVQDLGLQVTPDSLYRERRVREYLENRHGALIAEDFRAALADRFGRPFAVCRDATLGFGGDRVSTVATVIMDVAQGRMWIAPVPYRSEQYFEYNLTDVGARPVETIG